MGCLEDENALLKEKLAQIDKTVKEISRKLKHVEVYKEKLGQRDETIKELSKKLKSSEGYKEKLDIARKTISTLETKIQLHIHQSIKWQKMDEIKSGLEAEINSLKKEIDTKKEELLSKYDADPVVQQQKAAYQKLYQEFTEYAQKYNAVLSVPRHKHKSEICDLRRQHQDEMDKVRATVLSQEGKIKDIQYQLDGEKRRVQTLQSQLALERQRIHDLEAQLQNQDLPHKKTRPNPPRTYCTTRDKAEEAVKKIQMMLSWLKFGLASTVQTFVDIQKEPMFHKDGKSYSVDGFIGDTPEIAKMLMKRMMLYYHPDKQDPTLGEHWVYFSEQVTKMLVDAKGYNYVPGVKK